MSLKLSRTLWGSCTWIHITMWSSSAELKLSSNGRHEPPDEAFLSLSLFFFFLVFLGLHPRQMEVPRPGVESELQLLAYTRATAAQNPSSICNLHHSSRQHWNLNPLNKDRNQTRILVDTSQVHFPWAMTGSPSSLFYFREKLQS